MPRIATAIKALTGAIEKEEIPTFEDLAEITRLVAELTATVVPDEDDSSSGEDVSSVECDTDEGPFGYWTLDSYEPCCRSTSSSGLKPGNRESTSSTVGIAALAQLTSMTTCPEGRYCPSGHDRLVIA